jgi:hypothetical protein
MDQHVTVRVRLEAVRVGNTLPTEGDKVAVAEAMGIETVADSHGRQMSDYETARDVNTRQRRLGGGVHYG